MTLIGFLFFLLVLYCLWHICLVLVGVAAFYVAIAVIILFILSALSGGL